MHDRLSLFHPIYTLRPVYKTLANSADPDRTQNVASDQGLHSLLTERSIYIQVKKKNTHKTQTFKWACLIAKN